MFRKLLNLLQASRAGEWSCLAREVLEEEVGVIAMGTEAHLVVVAQA